MNQRYNVSYRIRSDEIGSDHIIYHISYIIYHISYIILYHTVDVLSNNHSSIGSRIK